MPIFCVHSHKFYVSRYAVVFNLANKQCLNSWHHPWALASTHLGVGTACMLPLWMPLPRGREADGTPKKWRSVRAPPSLSWSDLRAIMPVVALLATGHVTSTLAPAYGTVAFSNIIKTAEPLFTCFFSVMLYRKVFPPGVYLSLLFVVCGVMLVSAREVNFSYFSLAAGMISNGAFALYSIGAKNLLATRDARSTYAILTSLSCLVLTPVALIMEWSELGASRLAAAGSTPAFTGWRLAGLLAFTGLVQYLSNEVAFCTLSMIHPITYALANTFKRSLVVFASLLFFRQSLPPMGAAGAAMALLGALGYSLAMERERARQEQLQAAAKLKIKSS